MHPLPRSRIFVGQLSQELWKRIQKHLSTISLAEQNLRQGKKRTPVANRYLKAHKGITRGTQVSGLEKITLGICGGNLTRTLLQAESRWIYRLGSLAPAR